MAVRVETEPGFTFGNAALLFEQRHFAGDATAVVGRTYDISPDGERFLIVQESGGDAVASTESILVLNWFEELLADRPASRCGREILGLG